MVSKSTGNYSGAIYKPNFKTSFSGVHSSHQKKRKYLFLQHHPYNNAHQRYQSLQDDSDVGALKIDYTQFKGPENEKSLLEKRDSGQLVKHVIHIGDSSKANSPTLPPAAQPGGKKRVLSLTKFKTLEQVDSFDNLPQQINFQLKENIFDDSVRPVPLSTIYAAKDANRPTNEFSTMEDPKFFNSFNKMTDSKYEPLATLPVSKNNQNVRNSVYNSQSIFTTNTQETVNYPNSNESSANLNHESLDLVDPYKDIICTPIGDAGKPQAPKVRKRDVKVDLQKRIKAKQRQSQFLRNSIKEQAIFLEQSKESSLEATKEITNSEVNAEDQKADTVHRVREREFTPLSLEQHLRALNDDLFPDKEQFNFEGGDHYGFNYGLVYGQSTAVQAKEPFQTIQNDSTLNKLTKSHQSLQYQLKQMKELSDPKQIRFDIRGRRPSMKFNNMRSLVQRSFDFNIKRNSIQEFPEIEQSSPSGGHINVRKLAQKSKYIPRSFKMVKNQSQAISQTTQTQHSQISQSPKSSGGNRIANSQTVHSIQSEIRISQIKSNPKFFQHLRNQSTSTISFSKGVGDTADIAIQEVELSPEGQQEQFRPSTQAIMRGIQKPLIADENNYEISRKSVKTSQGHRFNCQQASVPAASHHPAATYSYHDSKSHQQKQAVAFSSSTVKQFQNNWASIPNGPQHQNPEYKSKRSLNKIMIRKSLEYQQRLRQDKRDSVHVFRIQQILPGQLCTEGTAPNFLLGHRNVNDGTFERLDQIQNLNQNLRNLSPREQFEGESFFAPQPSAYKNQGEVNADAENFETRPASKNQSLYGFQIKARSTKPTTEMPPEKPNLISGGDSKVVKICSSLLKTDFDRNPISLKANQRYSGENKRNHKSFQDNIPEPKAGDKDIGSVNAGSSLSSQMRGLKSSKDGLAHKTQVLKKFTGENGKIDENIPKMPYTNLKSQIQKESAEDTYESREQLFNQWNSKLQADDGKTGAHENDSLDLYPKRQIKQNTGSRTAVALEANSEVLSQDPISKQLVRDAIRQVSQLQKLQPGQKYYNKAQVMELINYENMLQAKLQYEKMAKTQYLDQNSIEEAYMHKFGERLLANSQSKSGSADEMSPIQRKYYEPHGFGKTHSESGADFRIAITSVHPEPGPRQLILAGQILKDRSGTLSLNQSQSQSDQMIRVLSTAGVKTVEYWNKEASPITPADTIQLDKEASRTSETVIFNNATDNKKDHTVSLTGEENSLQTIQQESRDNENGEGRYRSILQRCTSLSEEDSQFTATVMKSNVEPSKQFLKTEELAPESADSPLLIIRKNSDENVKIPAESKPSLPLRRKIEVLNLKNIEVKSQLPHDNKTQSPVSPGPLMIKKKLMKEIDDNISNDFVLMSSGQGPQVVLLDAQEPSARKSLGNKLASKTPNQVYQNPSRNDQLETLFSHTQDQ